MRSTELDDAISSSTIKILKDLMESADCPPSFSQVCSCWTASACTDGACPSRVLPKSACFCALSESRRQLVVTASVIFTLLHVHAIRVKPEVGTPGHRHSSPARRSGSVASDHVAEPAIGLKAP